MASHIVYEPDNVYDNVDTYNVGDTVEYISNNQLGYMRYVVAMVDGAKDLRAVADIDGPFDDDEDAALEGGKRRRRKMRKTRKTRKNKTRHAKKRTAHKKRTMRKKMVKRRRAKTLSKRK